MTALFFPPVFFSAASHVEQAALRLPSGVLGFPASTTRTYAELGEPITLLYLLIATPTAVFEIRTRCSDRRPFGVQLLCPITQSLAPSLAQQHSQAGTQSNFSYPVFQRQPRRLLSKNTLDFLLSFCLLLWELDGLLWFLGLTHQPLLPFRMRLALCFHGPEEGTRCSGPRCEHPPVGDGEWMEVACPVPTSTLTCPAFPPLLGLGSGG